MTRLEDLRKALEATIENLSPAKAQQLAKGLLEPGAAKDQVSKTAADLLGWSQRNRSRLSEMIRREITQQLRGVGAATQGELDALKRRVRELERAAGMTASGRAKTAAAKKATPKAAAAKKPAAKAPRATRDAAPRARG